MASLRNSREFRHDFRAEIAFASDRFAREIFRPVPLWHLLRLIAPVFVDDPPAFDRRPRFNHIRPTLEIFVNPNIQKLCRIGIAATQNHAAIPRPDRHIGDGIIRPRDKRHLSQAAVGRAGSAFVRSALYRG